MLAETETATQSIPRRTEYSAPFNPERLEGRNHPVAVSHRWLRVLYFCFASVWGFLCGAIGLAIILPADGRVRPLPGALMLLMLLPALLAAILGGAVSAAAYREARRRAGK